MFRQTLNIGQFGVTCCPTTAQYTACAAFDMQGLRSILQCQKSNSPCRIPSMLPSAIYTTCASTSTSNLCVNAAAQQQLFIRERKSSTWGDFVPQPHLIVHLKLYISKSAPNIASPVSKPLFHFISSSRARHKQECHLRQSAVAITGIYISSSGCVSDSCKGLANAFCLNM